MDKHKAHKKDASNWQIRDGIPQTATSLALALLHHCASPPPEHFRNIKHKSQKEKWHNKRYRPLPGNSHPLPFPRPSLTTLAKRFRNLKHKI